VISLTKPKAGHASIEQRFDSLVSDFDILRTDIGRLLHSVGRYPRKNVLLLSGAERLVVVVGTHPVQRRVYFSFRCKEPRSTRPVEFPPRQSDRGHD
jgi:hypothetical protein